MKLLLDEMMPRAIAEQLRIRGHDAELVADRDLLRTKSDEIIWATARAEWRVIVTEDTDYRVFMVELALLGDAHPGIIFTSPRSLRDEYLNGERFDTLLEAQVLIEAWRNEYNRIRPHSSLGYRSPAPEVVAGAPLLRDETLTLQVV